MHESFSFKLREKLSKNCDAVQSVCIKISSTKSKNIILYTIYRPLNSDMKKRETINGDIKNVVLAGNFNINVLDFETNKKVPSHKKRKDSLEGSLDLILFAVELDFPKILVSRLPQNTSNVNIECAGKSKQLYSLCDQLLEAMIYLNFIILILIFFLIDDAWCKLCNIWLLLCENNSRSITIQELNTS